jgi:MoaA/NifB/PqqE/SkfB family radical SAM enzyme
MLGYFKKKLGQRRYVKNLGQVYRYLFSEVKSIEIAITYACNFHCKGCYAGDLRENVMLSKEEIKKIVDKYRPMHINITGGEPMLHPKIYEIISEMPKSVVVSMVTNGSLLNEEKIKKLKRCGLNTIQISYGKNYPWLHNLQLACYAKKAGLNVCLSVTNTKENKDYIEQAIDISEKKGYHVLFNLPHGILEKSFDKETYFKYRNHPLVREDNMFWKGKDKCPAGTKKIYITAKGELMPCDRLHKVYNSYEEMKKEFKHNCVYCTRWGNLK